MAVLDRIGRWLRQSARGQALASFTGAGYIRLVARTTRWQIEGRDKYDALMKPGQGVISCAWHGRLFLSPLWVIPGRAAVAMISNNRDGDLISALVRRFGVVAVRGSTYDHAKQRDKGGAEAFAGGAEVLRDGALLAITPDGPRGPRMRAQRGIALLSIQTGAPIQPIAFSTMRGKTLRGWDRFLIPWPFGRGVQLFGDPLWPPKDQEESSVLAYLDRIETMLIDLTHRADDLCGRARVEPGPPIAGS